MALTDLTRISTSGIATGTSLSGAILHGDAHFRGTNAGITSALFDSSDNALEFNDDVKLKLGNSGDFEIYHRGADGVSIINETGSAYLSIGSNGNKVELYDTANGRAMAEFATGGACSFKHGATTRFQTTQAGAVVTGILTATSFSGPISGSPISNPSGISTFYDLKVTNNLTVEGTTTTLDTNLIGVDRVEVGANSNSIVGVAITQSGTADLVNLFDGATKVVAIDDTGKVGIGTDAPTQLIDVLKTSNMAKVKVRTTGAGAYFEADSVSSGYHGLILSSGGTQRWLMGGYASNNFTIKDGSAASGDERFTIVDGTGKVGINSTSPSERLDVVGNIKASGTITGSSFVGALPISNDGNNRVITAGGDGGLNAESNFTYSGTDATLKGTTDGVLNLDTTDGRGSFIRFKENETTKNWVGCSEGIGTGGDQDDLGLRATDNIFMRTGSAVSLHIDSDGNITNTGIATSFVTTTFSANFAKLDLRGTNIANSNHYLLSYGAGHANNQEFHMVNTLGEIVFRTGSGSDTDRLRIDTSGRISNNSRVATDYGSPNLLISGTNSMFTMMGDGSINNSSYTGIKFRVAGASTGDYTKAGIFAQRRGGYNDLDLIFALDTVADSTGVSDGDGKVRIKSDGHVLFSGLTTKNDTRNAKGITIKSSSGGGGISFQNFGSNGSRNWRIRPDDLIGWGTLEFSVSPTANSSTDWPDTAADVVLALQPGREIDTGSKTITGGNNLAIQNFRVKGIWSGSPSIGKSIELISGYDSSVKMAAIGYNLTDVNLGSTYGGDLTFHTQPLYSSPTTPLPVRMRISSKGYVTKPETPAFFATHTGATSPVTGTLTYNTSGTGYYNNGTHLSTSTGKFTAPVAGMYHFHFHGFVQSNASSSYFETNFVRYNAAGNNTTTMTRQYGDNDWTGNDYGPSFSMQLTCEMEVNDKMYVVHNGCGLHGSNGYYFGGYHIG